MARKCLCSCHSKTLRLEAWTVAVPAIDSWSVSGHRLSTRQESVEKRRLQICGVAKVAQPNPNQAKVLLRSQINALPERESDLRQLLASRRRQRRSVAASENAEIAGFQFQYNGARDAR